ncbi:uncharacterized protein LOC143034870 [Oratosquilla oratoria]|uniref:uncharacterized protein LOC143034870 n=1 Tax=Oratosquilla oratoria TaxID=337810 RepID=UPI003F7645D4
MVFTPVAVSYKKNLENIQGGKNVNEIYLYFANAFNKIDHDIPLHKLRTLGIRGNLGEWLHSFFTKRTQQVKVQGTLSEPSQLISRVPQGSVLDPLLFLIMIGDGNKDLHRSHVTFFADDPRIVRDIHSASDVPLL